MAAPSMMDVVDLQLAKEMSEKDVKIVPGEEVQEDQVESVDEQDFKIVSAPPLEEGQKLTVDPFATYMQVEAHDWQNRIRNGILGLISLVPTVGRGVSMLVGLFWPANKVDIWVAINAEQYIRNIVRQEIFEFELQQVQSEIQALDSIISRYDRAGLNEKGNFLTSWIVQADRLSFLLRNSSNNIHLLLHIVAVAALHVAALHERLTFGEELYGENNTANWTQDLVEKFETYTSDSIPEIFNNWKQWRETQFEIRAWRQAAVWGNNSVIRPASSHATVEDKLTGEIFTFQRTNIYSTTVFSENCEDQKTRMINEAIADMASCISPTFGFHKLLPDNIQTQLPAYDRVQFGLVFRGPYSQDLLRRFNTVTNAYVFRTRTTQSYESVERILQVIVRAGHHVDALQFLHSSFEGPMIGNPAGGVRFQVDVRDRSIHDIRMEFSHNVLASLQFHFEDGTATQRYGNTTGWASNIATCTVPFGYRFTSNGSRVDPGPYGTSAISVIRFHFTPEDL